MRRFGVAGLFVLLLSFAVASPVTARPGGTTATWHGTWQGQTVTIVVVARGHTVSATQQRNEPWWAWGNTSSDAYLFYWSADRLVDLIVDFTTRDGTTTARIYAPNLQEQRLGVQVGDEGYAIPAMLRPALELRPRTGTWLVDGKPNFNLDGFEINTSGQQWSISTGGAGPGLPSWATRRLAVDPQPDEGYVRFGAAYRADPTVPYETVDPLIPSWPYLSTGVQQDHFGAIQPIFYNRRERVLTQNWVGFHIAGMYQINSIAYPPAVNFEAPFAFYRFSSDAGRHANLVIRSDVWPAGDPFGPPPKQQQRTAIRMTWTGSESELWRYSLTVAGSRAPDETVTIGDAQVRAISYDHYLSWVANHSWDTVTFVEDTNGVPGSEGIYDYSMEDNYGVSLWLHGETDAPPDDYRAPYLRIPSPIDPRRLSAGKRGEYSMNYRRSPQFYFSSVDNRPHLLYAEGGVWNLGDGTVLRMHNLDGGPYINGWTRERPRVTSVATRRRQPTTLRAYPGKAEESLYALSGFLIYSGKDGATLRRVRLAPATRPLPSPTTAALWRTFIQGVTVEPSARRDPRNLQSWVTAVPGESVVFPRGTISGVRATDAGFRFVLDVPALMTFQSDLLTTTRLRPGRYVVRYDGQLHVAPLTPPRLTVNLQVGALREEIWGSIGVNVGNSGLQDFQHGTVELLASSPRIQETVVTSATLTVLGQSESNVGLLWAPKTSGEWTIKVRIRDASSQVVQSATEPVIVLATDVRPRTLLQTTNSLPMLFLIGLGMLVLASLGASIMWRAFVDAERPA